jgi:shikimate 5-dehydrogenase/3-dehydroquinate dehydratase
MIILTIPYSDSSSLVAFDKAIEYDFIEYRLDYYADLTKIDLSPFRSQNILTLRSAEEGGKQQISLTTKKQILSRILNETTSLVDCEYSFLLNNPDFSIQSDRLILSLHCSINDSELIREFMETEIKARYFKLAISCSRITQLDDIHILLKDSWKDKFILVPMYPCSVTARLLYKFYGSIATYTYNQEITALNQPSYKLSKVCRIKDISIDTEIYAIVGKEQILSSLSVSVYNKWFSEKNSNRVLLPIVSNTAEEAIEYIQFISKIAHLKGVAITMPFKKEIVAKYNPGISVANSWLPTLNEFNNTDEIAMEKALLQVGVNSNSHVLILGTGATSEIAYSVLQKHKLVDIKIVNREKMIRADVDNHWRQQKYDLIINCTPYGLLEIEKSIPMPDFKALIDLPYGKVETLLVEKAKQYNVPYVDGFMFWKWQAQAQALFWGLETEFLEYLDRIDLSSFNKQI